MLKPILLTEHSSEIVTLTLNRPERCNAFSLNMLEQFHSHLCRLERDRQRRVVILRGAGKMFCSGMDLAEAAENTLPEEIEQAKNPETFPWRKSHQHKIASFVAEIFVQLRRMPQIVICAPHGFACGGGGGLIAASDLVVAADDLKIMFPELKRGLKPVLLFPLLRRKLSDSALRWMVLTGTAIDAQCTRKFGLVHDIVRPDMLDEAALSLARDVCLGEPETVHHAKQQMQSPGTGHDIVKPNMLCDFELFKEEMQQAVEQHTRSWFSVSAQEGVAAFLEKRLPEWMP